MNICVSDISIGALLGLVGSRRLAKSEVDDDGEEDLHGPPVLQGGLVLPLLDGRDGRRRRAAGSSAGTWTFSTSPLALMIASRMTLALDAGAARHLRILGLTS